jgi:hypothetical protein
MEAGKKTLSRQTRGNLNRFATSPALTRPSTRMDTELADNHHVLSSNAGSSAKQAEKIRRIWHDTTRDVHHKDCRKKDPCLCKN